MTRQRYLLHSLMIFVILLSFLLRVYRLGSEASFSTDEVTTVTSSMRGLAEIWKLEHRTPLQALWIRLGALGLGFGYTEFAVYFMSVVTGVLAVAVVYRLGRSLFNHRVGLLCAFMLTFSAYHIYWSRSARYYSLMVFLSSAAFLCLYRALITNSRRAWLGYALFRTLSLYDHLTALWLWAGEIVFALVYLSLPVLKGLWKHKHSIRNLDTLVWLRQEKKIRWRGQDALSRLATSKFLGLAISMALILLACAPVWYSLLQDIYLGSSALRFGGISSEQLDPRDPRTGQPRPVLGGGWRSPLLVLHLLDARISPLHVVMMIGFAGGLLFCALRRQWMQLLFTLALMVTPFVLTANMRSYSLVLDGRYLISLLPLYYVMVGRGISGFGHQIASMTRSGGNRWAYVPQAVVVAFAFVYAGLSFTRIPLSHRNTGQDWHAASRFLAEKARPDQLIVVPGGSTLPKALQYYLPGFKVVGEDPYLSYDTLYQAEDGFWLVFQPGTDMYTWLRQWVDKYRAVSLIFTAGWFPDIDQDTDLAPGQIWDLYVVYASRAITSTEQALQMHHSWLADAEAHNPGDVRRHLTLAEAYQRFDRCDLAVPEYSLALKEEYANDQLTSYIYDARGTCWHRLGKTERAISDWQRAIAHADWIDEPYEHLCVAYIQLGRADEAQASYRAAIAANPKRAWPHVLLGDFYRRRGLAEQAIAEYRKAILLEPGDRTAYLDLGEMYAAEGERTRVISLYQEAMQRNPWSGWPHFQLGQFYQSVGQVAEAVAEYRRAVELQPAYAPSVSKFLRDVRWDLAAVLNLIHAYSDQGQLLWWPGNSWVKPHPHDPDILVGRSILTVGGRVQGDQLFIHPFGDQENTYLEFEIPNSSFAYLDVGCGLADEVVGLSNGVQYLIEVRRQGDEGYQPLFDLVADDNVWEERTVSLIPYWGEDLQFRLVVNARGDYAYDWLQTTVELVPPPHPVWDLSANLGEARFSPDGLPLEWRGSAFYTPDGSRLVGRSELPVGGRSLPGQVILHPFSSEVDSILLFSLPHHPYRALKTSFGLADEALLYSNGVDYTVSVSADGGRSFTDLIQTDVTTNTWRSLLVDLPPSQDLLLKLIASARQDATFDWLQVKLDLLPLDDEEETPGLVVDDEMTE